MIDFDGKGSGGVSVNRIWKEKGEVSGQSRWWCHLLTGRRQRRPGVAKEQLFGRT